MEVATQALIANFILLAGFVIGLGAVNVIDIHGFLGRKSGYWSEATIRTHKITKPLIWIGMVLVLVGSFLVYGANDLFLTIQLVIIAVLVLNGTFLSFWVSPRLVKREGEGRAREIIPQDWQTKITASLIISDFGWWASLLLYAYFISLS